MKAPTPFYWLLALLAGTPSGLRAAAYVWTGSSGTAWNTPANWSPVGVPGAADQVTIGAATNAPRLEANCSLAGLTMGGGSLDLGGFTLTVTGDATLEAGNPRNGRLLLNGPTVRFGPCLSPAASGPTLDALVTVNTTVLSMHGTTFNQAVTFTAAQSGDCYQGGNRFQAPVSFTYVGSTLIFLGHTEEKNVYNADLTLTNVGSGFIAVNWNEFNGNVLLNSSGGDIWFGYANTASQMAAGKSLSVGSFPAGGLKLFNFTQLGNAPQALTLTGSAYLWVQNSVFNGPVAWVAPHFNLMANAFQQASRFEKTGASKDEMGNNIFHGPTTFLNAGTGWIMLAYSGRDVYHGEVTLTNTGTGTIYPAANAAGSEFNGDVIFNCTNGGGIFFSGGGGTSTLAAGKTLRIGSAGFSTGRLMLDGLTQRGNTPQNLTLTGDAALWMGSVYGTRSEFEGPVNFKAPRLLLNGAVYRSDARFEIAASNWGQGSYGSNEFYGRTQLINSGTDQFMLAGNNTANKKEVFNGELTLSNTGTGSILLGGSQSYEFNGDLVLNSTGGSGFRFEGTARLAAGKTLRVGSLGFSAGDFWVYNFTQLGSTPQSLTLSGSTRLYLNGCRFEGPVRFSAPALFVDYNFFGAESEFIRTATTYSAWQGGNVFTRKMRFINQGGWEVNLSYSADNTLVR